MTATVLTIGDAEHVPHPLHAPDRIWNETNCYVDVLIEVLHALGLDAHACGAYLLAADFEGDQWTFVKPPVEDLRALYGIEIAELNVWRPVLDHVAEQLSFGRLLTVEVDAFHLPDTRGVSYGLEHVKTTIVPADLDIPGRYLGYFHNSGFHQLDGPDFDAIFAPSGDEVRLPPYVEVIKWNGPRRDAAELRRIADRQVGAYLQRAPGDNPVLRMGKRIVRDLEWLVQADLPTFHQYAFGTCRQSGGTAELLADFVLWLYGNEAEPTAAAFRTAANSARALQFNLARAARQRRFDVDAPLAEMATAWASAMTLLATLRESHAR